MKKERAVAALKFIIPLLCKYKFRWCIAGGFACCVYGVKRPITDIDIDIETSKSNPQFKKFLSELKEYTTEPLEHWVDKNYDNYNVECNYQGQIIDFSPTKNLKIFYTDRRKYDLFYEAGFPEPEIVSFAGMKLPLLSKESIIRNKEMLVWKRKSDYKDIVGLEKLLEKKQARALKWIVGILRTKKIPFQVTGGLAARAYGSKRPLNDIDLDVPEADFDRLEKRVKQYITFGPAQFKDKKWDLELITLNYHGQDIDIGGAYKAKIRDEASKKWKPVRADLAKSSRKTVLGCKVPVVDPKSLVEYKKLYSGVQQEVDVAAIKKYITGLKKRIR